VPDRLESSESSASSVRLRAIEVETRLFGFFFTARRRGDEVEILRWRANRLEPVGHGRWEGSRLLANTLSCFVEAKTGRTVIRRLEALLRAPRWPTPGGEFHPRRVINLLEVVAIRVLADFAERHYKAPRYEVDRRYYRACGKRYPFTHRAYDAVRHLLEAHKVSVRVRKLKDPALPGHRQESMQAARVLELWVQAVLLERVFDLTDVRAMDAALRQARVPLPAGFDLEAAGRRALNARLGGSLKDPEAWAPRC